MSKTVVVREDDRDLAELVRELLTDAGFEVCTVIAVEELLQECARRSPCVALIDGNDPAGYDLWWLGPKLRAMGVPPVAFTAHAAARREFARDPHDFEAVIGKPFDADEFVSAVEGICWEDGHAASA